MAGPESFPVYCILFFVCKQNAQCIARIIHDTFMDTFQLVFLLMPYFSSQRKVHGNFALRHMIVFSNFEIKEMFWLNNFFFLPTLFRDKMHYSPGEVYCSSPLWSSKLFVLFPLHTQFSQLIIFKLVENIIVGENLMQSTGKPPKNSIKMQRNSLKPYKSNLFINVSLLLLCR